MAMVSTNATAADMPNAVSTFLETPGLGSKAADWFKKGNKGDITGMNPGEAALTVSKDGGKVDAITASTITSRAFLNAVNAAYAAYAGQETADGTTGATQKNVEQPADSAAPEAVDTLSAK